MTPSFRLDAKVLRAKLSAALVVLSVAVGCVAGCAERRIDYGEESATAPAASAPATSPASNRHLVDAFDYAGHPAEGTRYYFTTPSGRWACAIVPRERAGCQSAGGWRAAIPIAGAPDAVTDASGRSVAPNAVVVDRDGDARFIALEQSEFAPDTGTANVLPFNRILAAAGFRCNVQEDTGVACLSERSGKGFTFSGDAFEPRYTDVPADAP